MAAIVASGNLAGGLRVELYEGGELRIIESTGKKQEIKLSAVAGLDLLTFLAEQAGVMNARLAEDYGPAARTAEHKRGQHIRYMLDRKRTASGEILWVCAPTQVEEREIPVRYVVAPDGGDFVDIVFPADVLEAAPGA